MYLHQRKKKRGWVDENFEKKHQATETEKRKKKMVRSGAVLVESAKRKKRAGRLKEDWSWMEEGEAEAGGSLHYYYYYY